MHPQNVMYRIPCRFALPPPPRNYLYVHRNWGAKRAEQHIPAFAKDIVRQYDKDGAVTKRLSLKPKF